MERFPKRMNHLARAVAGVIVLIVFNKQMGEFSYISRMTDGNTIMNAFMWGFTVMRIVVTVILVIYLLRNILGFVMSFLSDDTQMAEANKGMIFMAKVQEIISIIYKMIIIILFGLAVLPGIVMLFEGNRYIYMMAAAIVILLGVLLVRSMISIIQIVRRDDSAWKDGPGDDDQMWEE